MKLALLHRGRFRITQKLVERVRVKFPHNLASNKIGLIFRHKNMTTCT